jgi:hypothetical protein
MGFFKKKSLPPMTEIYPSAQLQKFDSGRTPADVLQMILHISEGIYAMESNNHTPKFKSLSEFDASAKEILGSLTSETFRRFVQMLLFEPDYLNRFIEVSATQLNSVHSELRELLNLEVPLSTNTINRFSQITHQIPVLIQEFTAVMTDLKDYVTIDSVVLIAGMTTEAHQFALEYYEEMKRSINYVEEYQGR